MKKWVEIDFAHLMILLASVFFMIFLWQIMVTNHRKDIDRDKYLATHCKQVNFGYDMQCDNTGDSNQ